MELVHVCSLASLLSSCLFRPKSQVDSNLYQTLFGSSNSKFALYGFGVEAGLSTHTTSVNEFFTKGRYSVLGIGRATAPVSRAHQDSSLGGHTYTLTHTYTHTYRHT